VHIARPSSQNRDGKGKPRLSVATGHKLHGALVDHDERDAWKQVVERGRSIMVEDVTNPFNGLSIPRHRSWDPDNSSPQQTQRRDFTFDRTTFNQANTYIFECSGVLWDISDLKQNRLESELQPLIVTKVNEIIEADKRVLFLSNNPAQSRRMMVEKLGEKGIKIGMAEDGESAKATEHNIISIGHTCAWWLKSQKSAKPFVMASHTGVLEDLRDGGITDYVATIEDDGSAREIFKKPVTEGNVSRLICELPEVDSVLMGWDSEITSFKVAVAATYLRTNVPLLTCCSADAQRKIERLGSGSLARCSGILFPSNTPAVDLRMPSQALFDALKSPLEAGGYGVVPEEAVWIGGSFDKSIEFAFFCGMRCLFICNSALDKMDLAIETREWRLPDWSVASFAEV